jgi:hypothetical protein
MHSAHEYWLTLIFVMSLRVVSRDRFAVAGFAN